MHKDTKRHLLEWAIYLVAVVTFSILFVTFVAQRTRVNGHSMEPTYQEGDQLIVNKISCRFSSPDRNDVIVFDKPDENRKLIKRVVAIPGDSVQIVDGALYVNNKRVNDPFSGMQKAGCAASEIMLDQDEYFVLGDNRGDSHDSRDFGPIKKRQIIGKAQFKIKFAM